MRFIVIAYRLGETHLFAEAATDAKVPVDAVRQRDRLGVRYVRRRSAVQAAIKFVDRRNGADLTALAAPRAGGRIDVAWVSAQSDLEMPLLAFQCMNLGIGNDLNVRIAADLDQLG